MTYTITQHCAVFGDLTTLARKWGTNPPKKYAQYDTSVQVWFIQPRKRKAQSYTMLPDNFRYLTVTNKDGETLFDSREVVPCDMEAWHETYNKQKKIRDKGEAFASLLVE